MLLQIPKLNLLQAMEEAKAKQDAARDGSVVMPWILI